MLDIIVLTGVLSAQDPCAGYDPARLEDDFNACLEGEWGEEDCDEGRRITFDGFTGDDGQSCRFDAMQWDPSTGGFRLSYECQTASGEYERAGDGVWIVENGVIHTGDSVTPYEPLLYRCEAGE